MSAAVYISAESPSAADKIAVNGKYFVLHIDNISTIGEDHGLKRLDEYISSTLDDVLELADESITPREKIQENFQEQWFDPGEGLALIDNYIDLVKNYHSLSETSKSQCLEDLQGYKAVLEILAKENIRWHFSYDL
jgi:hypothetical protein